MARNLPSPSLKEYTTAGVVIAILLALSIVEQFSTDSMFNVVDATWKSRLNIHVGYYPFSVRVFTTYPVLWLGELLGGRYELAFACLQFSLLAVIGFLFYRYLRLLQLSHGFALAGVVAFFGAYPVMAAFHLGVESWDDFWQYSALILSFSLLLERKFLWSTVAFAFGVAARDATLLFFPVWAIAFVQAGDRRTNPRNLLTLFPILTAFLFWYFPDKEPSARTINSLAENFRDPRWTLNSLYSLVMGQGFLWLLIPSALRAYLKGRIPLTPEERFLGWGTIVVLPVVTAVVLTNAFARETRLFLPPIVLSLPLVLKLIASRWNDFRGWLKPWHFWCGAGLTAAGLYVVSLLAFVWFPSFDYRSDYQFARMMFTIHITAGFLGLVLIHVPKSRQ
jgi:hypothetical protein